MKRNKNNEVVQSMENISQKEKIKRKEHNSDAYPEEFEEFRSMDLRMKPQPFKQPVKKSRRKKENDK